MKAYPEYRVFDGDWLEKVPSHWTLGRIKDGVRESKNGTWGAEPDGGVGDVRTIRVADFDRVARLVHDNDVTFRSVPTSEQAFRRVITGDLLLEKSGGTHANPVGTVVRYQGDAAAVCSNFVARIRLLPTQSSRYWTYLHAGCYVSGLTQRSVKQTTGIQNLDQQSYFAEAVAIPPAVEQNSIANYLDRETARIDELIREQESLVSALRARRQASITAAVSQGSSAPLPLRRDITLLTSGSRGWAMYDADSGTRFIRIADLPRRSLKPKTIDLKYVEIPHGVEGSRTKLHRGDLVFSITAYLGSVGLVGAAEQGAFVSQHVALCRLSSKRWLPAFVGWFTLGDDGQRQLNEQAYGGTKQQLALDDIRELRVPVPSLADQAIVVDLLETETAQLDLLVTECRELVRLLQERRTALITAAVTGQIDVRSEVDTPDAEPTDRINSAR